MKKAYCIFLFVLLMVNLYAQNTYTKLYYKNTSPIIYHAIASVGNNGYILGGRTNDSTGSSNTEALLTRIDSTGNIIYSKRIGDTEGEHLSSVTKTHDSCFVFVGESHTSSTSIHKIILIKVNAAGDTLWCQRSTGSPTEEAKTVYECADHGFIVSGNSGGNGLLAKFDSTGVLEWKNEINAGVTTTTCNSARQTSDGGYIASFYLYTSLPFDYKGAVMKFDGMGNLSWAKQYSNSYCLDAMEDSGELILYPGGIGIIKTDLSGNVLSAAASSSVIGSSKQGLYKSQATGEFVFTGYMLIDTMYRSALVSLYPSGSLHHLRTYGFDGFESIVTDGANGFAILGWGPLHIIGSPTDSAGMRTSIISTDTAFNAVNCYPDPVISPPTSITVTSTTITPVISPTGGSTRYYPSVNLRLINVDSGCVDIITSIPQPRTAETFNIYPNPSEGNFEIQLNKDYQISDVVLYDIYGRKVLTNTINKFTNILQLDASEIPSGLYIVELRIGNKSLKKKIIITH